MNIFTNEEIQDIINIYKETEDINLLIDKYHTSERYLRQVLKENKIDRHYGYISDELQKRIGILYLKGLNQRQISEETFVSDPAIRKYLKGQNIPMRSTSECNMRYKRNKHYFDEIDTPNKAYILGLLYADGCNHTSHNSITLVLQAEDMQVIERVKQELEYEGNIRFSAKDKPQYKDKYILCINDEYMSNQLNKIGMVDNKSLILEFPKCVPMNLINHFVRGYFDGDGCIYLNKEIRKTEICIAGTLDMIKRIHDIAVLMNCSCSICHPKQCGESNTYTLRINGYHNVKNFMNWMYDNADIKMERKYNKYLEVVKMFESTQNSQVA